MRSIRRWLRPSMTLCCRSATTVRSDEVQALVCSYDDPRIVYHRNSEDIGGQANWLAIIERAETPLVASLHDDDAWHPDFLAKLVPPMLEHRRRRNGLRRLLPHGCRWDAATGTHRRTLHFVPVATASTPDGSTSTGPRVFVGGGVERAAACDRCRHPTRVGTAHRIPRRDHPAVRHLDLVPDGAALGEPSTSFKNH